MKEKRSALERALEKCPMLSKQVSFTHVDSCFSAEALRR